MSNGVTVGYELLTIKTCGTRKDDDIFPKYIPVMVTRMPPCTGDMVG